MIPDIIKNRFDDYKKDVPKFIKEKDEYYGEYIMRPVVFISFDYYYDGMSRDSFRRIQNMMIDANSKFRNVIDFWTIKNIDSNKKSETYIVYAVDLKDNKDWFIKNKDCDYLKNVKSKVMPFAVDTDKIFPEYWDKYPFTKI
jgi:hypothetical protein